MKQERKSPLKDKPLRHPGQSLEEERQKLIDDVLEAPLLLALMFCFFAAVEWWRYFVQLPPQPVLFTVVASVAVIFAAWRLLRLRPRLKALRLGVEGEKAVGQYLERLRQSGYQVFHDVVGTDFNIDHVLIGPAGVFTIETKTWSKPARGNAQVSFDGEQLVVAGAAPSRDPIVQARAQATWLQRTLAESTGKTLRTFPVVLFPGWFVEQAPGSTKDLWVLEPKALPAFLERAPEHLSPEDVRLAAFHLSRYIRVGEQHRAEGG